MGAEHKQMSSFLLRLLIDVPLPQAQSSELISTTKALLDFLYMLQYSVHSETTLKALEGSLANFHAKKDVFIRLGAHSHFLIPKLHMITHYVHAIKLYGMTDNYNTEMTKHLHIDFVKEAYHVMSHKDEFLQMTKWLECREKVLQLADYIQWCMLCADSGHDTMITLCQGVHWQPPDLACTVFHLMTKYPSHKAVPVTQLISLDSYGATHLMPVLAHFLVEHNNPGSHGVKSNFKLCLFGFPSCHS